MKSLTAFLILCFIATISFGQIQYEKGYIIDKNNKRTECYIKNMDWKDNPATITYKLSLSGSPIKGDVTTIKEFAIGNTFKYVGANVKVDLLNKPTVGTQSELDPVWTRANLFLKVLLEGKAKLYGYKKDKVERYFYSLNDSLINPLTYKQIHKASTIIRNNDFRQQLWDKLRLPNTTWEVTKTVNYTENELKNYFKTYNGKFEVPITETKPVAKKLYFNLKLTPGVNLSSTKMTVVERDGKPELTFDSKPGLRLGLEAELNIPFDHYRWGILLEPTFQTYKSEAAFAQKPTTITYNTVEFPFGLRYYVYLSNNSRVFLDGLYVPGVAMNMGSKIEYYSIDQSDRKMDNETASNMAFGVGFQHQKFSVEARYFTTKDILNNHDFEFADYNRFAVILGYKFMSKNLKK
jgi:hypothetical protein